MSDSRKKTVKLYGECIWHGRQSVSNCIFAGLKFECGCHVYRLRERGWFWAWAREPEMQIADKSVADR